MTALLVNPYRFAPPAVTIGSDSFDRANGALHGSTLDNGLGGSGTRTWTGYTSAGSTAADLFSISSNKVVNGATTTASTIASDFGDADVAVTATIVALPTTAICRLVARGGANPQQDSLRLSIGTNGSLTMVRNVAGVVTTIGTAAAGAVVAGDTVTLSCLGSSIRALVNAVEVIAPVTETAGQTNTKHGLAKGTSAVLSMDAFTVVET